MKCPACNAVVSWRSSVGGSRFRCSACHNTARIARSYSLVLIAVGAVTAGLLAYALGARGEVLIASIFMGVYPIDKAASELGTRDQAAVVPSEHAISTVALHGGDEPDALATSATPGYSLRRSLLLSVNAAPLVDDLQNPLGGLLALLPVHGRSGFQQQAAHGGMIPAVP